MSGSATMKTNSCIVGGGPAGMMTGFLLARAGIPVIVLEKHADFFRDFRGDTIHPSTMQIMHELGLLEDFLKLPHDEFQQLSVIYNGVPITIADFTYLKTAKPALGIMPQWDFLNFILKQAEKYKNFQILLQTKVTDIINENGRVTGVIAESPGGQIEIKADLIIGTDGRNSTVREKAGLRVISTGAPIDVLWFRLPKEPGDPVQTLGRFDYGRIMIMIGRGDYWQCGYIIEKNGYEKLKSAGLQVLKKELLMVSPFLNNRMDLIRDWDDIKLLNVVIDHLEKWFCEGLLCIGDAAHAMSPVGGVGINLAIQDAVATANILYKPLKEGKLTVKNLSRVQQRREFPTKVIQKMQVFLHKGIINRNMAGMNTKIPLFFKFLRMWPLLRRLPARIVGMGIRPEHIQIPKAE